MQAELLDRSSPPKRRPSAAEIAAATPGGRDRYVDLLRAFSILVVVLGHWLMAVVTWSDGSFGGYNALEEVPGAWALTWALQVMPLFFFVGGFSNFVSWQAARRDGRSYPAFLRGRVERLMRPTFVFVMVCLGVALAIQVVSPALSEQLRPAAEVISKPLWFLGVYILVVGLAPGMMSLHRRFGIGVPIALAAAAAVVDVVRLGLDVPAAGYLNFAFVWLFAHQLGFFYADGSLLRGGRGLFLAMAAGGLLLLTLLTVFGPYSLSMVGMAAERASNNSPPSICLLAMTIWLTGAALALRAAATRMLQRPQVWAAVVAAGSMIMTVFLWHLTALVVAALLALPLGFPQPPVGSGTWWALRPVWLGLVGLFLVPLVVLFSRFERPRFHLGASATASAAVPAGIVLLVAGLSGLAQFGFSSPIQAPGPSSPILNGALVGLGYALARAGQVGGRKADAR